MMTMAALGYRLATEADYELLRQLRKECGWGIEKLELSWGSPDWRFCVLTLEGGDVGMGGWALDLPQEPEAASRETKTVHLTSLFIRQKYQNRGFGSASMDILERVAVETFGAEWLTLDTNAYRCEWVEHPDGRYRFEHPDEVGKSVRWYQRRGYSQYKPNKLKFRGPMPGNPDRLLMAIFLKKRARPSGLGYRLAGEGDYELLKQLRRECGWGLDKLEKRWRDPDWKFCILTLRGEDVGMGGWALDFPDDQETASRRDHTVYLSSLFVRTKYQGAGLGTDAMDILERVAMDTFGAKAVTLDTCAYYTVYSEDLSTAVEHIGRLGKSVGWYQRRGYEQYKPHAKLFPYPTTDDPDYVLTAMFLKKRV